MSHPAESRPDSKATVLAPTDPLVGATIDGRYRIEGVLGEGGMGLVYRARHIMLNKALAVKVLRGEVSHNEQVIARFRQEAQSASAIGNQHIIDVSDFGILPDGSTYFVMELLDGSPLSRVIAQESPIAFGRLVHVARQLCDALGAAHGAGIVHRDLKPDNIFLVRRGNDADFVKVLDFGIAKVGGSSSKLTQVGQVFGTPHYMAPEQCQGLPVDGRADIYALGIILYELLTGHVPFDSESMVGLLTAQMIEPPPPPTSKRPDCPPALEAILMRCLEKSPDARYPDCASLQLDLEGFASGSPTWVPPRVSGIVESRPPRAPSSPPVGSHAPSVRPPSVRPSSAIPVAEPRTIARTVVLGGLAAMIVAGLAAGAVAIVVLERPASTSPNAPIVVLPTLPTVAPAPVASTPEVTTIRIETDPAGAEVLENDELLGVTPMELPRPRPGERRELVLRAAGFEERSIVLSSSTLGGSLRLGLRRASGSNRPVRASTPSSEPAQVVSAPPTPEPPAPRRPSTEVINPWGN